MAGLVDMSSTIIMALLAISIFLGLLPLTSIYEYSDRFPSIDVSISYRGYTWLLQAFESEPEFLLLVKDSSGRPLKAIYSLYAWMPSGEIKSLGIYGGQGIIRANYSILRDFSREWREYLASRNTDPKYVSPGIILLGAIHEDQGIYDSIKGVPIKIEEIIKNKSIAIEITEHLEAKKPIANHSRSQENRGIATGDIKLQNQWPPGSINDACNSVPWYTECYYWVLEENYGSIMGVPLPIVAAMVRGPEADKIDSISLRALYRSTSIISLNFMITASVASPSTPIDYRVVGPSIALRQDKTWLDQHVLFRTGIDFTPPAILGIGFLGDIAAARYRLYVMTCPWGFCTSTPTNTLANMTLMRPSIADNQMISYIMKDQNPYDGQGILEHALRYYMLNWAWSRDFKSQNYVYFDVFTVINDLNTYPIFSGSVNVLGILCGVWKIACQIKDNAPTIMGASVGVEQANQVYMLLFIEARLRSEYVNTGYWIWANYFYSPSTLLYGSSRSYIGSLYADIYVYRQ
ncbi:MAG: hypothetical protein RQ855_06395 [Desulfurococcales archaeon]|nr:hypothetical protein [Desulfurococcales archaeon]